MINNYNFLVIKEIVRILFKSLHMFQEINPWRKPHVNSTAIVYVFTQFLTIKDKSVLFHK